MKHLYFTGVALLIGVALYLVIQGTTGDKDSDGSTDSGEKKTALGSGSSDGGGDAKGRVVSSRKLRERSKPVTTESGLRYEVLEEGTGDRPGPTSKVKVHYVGTLADGTVFDSSRDRGQPATFPLNQVIKGWTEGLQLMKEGAVYRFEIPPDLAYGERGAGPSIPGNSTLTFEVELISIEKP
ncbi:MAG: FKBP-type peptidyl-prolyl cis-trans isomerase [Akkermansiaceae bacterium]